MKPAWKFLLLSLLSAAAAGCAAQQKASADRPGTQKHAEALQALENRRFIIRVGEAQNVFFTLAPKPVMNAPSSWVRMLGDRGAFHFDPELFPHNRIVQLRVEDDNAKLVREKTRRNGDVRYMLRIIDADTWTQHDFLITLYHDSNACYVQLDLGRKGMITNKDALRIRGCIFPLSE